MLKLVIRADDGSERQVDVREGPIRIGRSPDNDIVLADAAKGVSRAHAELRFENGRWVILDLNSQNGTWINGQRVQRAELPREGEITVGLYKLILNATAVSIDPRGPAPRPAPPATLVTPRPSPARAPHPPMAPTVPVPVIAGPAAGDLPLRTRDRSAPDDKRSRSTGTRGQSIGSAIAIGAAAIVMIAAGAVFLTRPSGGEVDRTSAGSGVGDGAAARGGRHASGRHRALQCAGRFSAGDSWRFGWTDGILRVLDAGGDASRGRACRPDHRA